MRGFQELGGRRNGDLMLIGAEFSIWANEKVLETNNDFLLLFIMCCYAQHCEYNKITTLKKGRNVVRLGWRDG
jgi:hypothetical protein